jgi:hypothetical protein
MSSRDALAAKHDQVLAIVAKHLDDTTLEIVKSALASDERMAIIRDAFIEGRDHEAVHMIRELDPIGFRRLLPASAGPTPIPAHTSAQIICHPQIAPFKVTHLLVSRTCAEFFNINDLRVGNRSQFVQSGDVPADLFEVDAPIIESSALDDLEPGETITIKIDKIIGRLGLALDLESVEVAMDLVLVVTNIDDLPHLFRAAWLGEIKAR